MRTDRASGDTLMARRAIVLAGGDSRRFGDRDKALAPVGGEPMLRHVARATAGATGQRPVVAVGSAERAERYRPVLDSAEFVIDATEPGGPVGGLTAALDRTTAEWLFLCGCDMPTLAPSAIDWQFERRGSADAVVPRAGEFRQPLHAWFRRPAIERALAGDVTRLQQLCDAVAETAIVPVEAAPDDVPLADSVRNVNTPDDV